MDDHAGVPSDAEVVTDQAVQPVPPPPERGPFFERTDWQSFSLAAALILSVYLFTLSPSVDLGNSGVFVTGAMYTGVPQPAGFPLWTLYAHLFTVLLPISNIAWRVSVSSAVAGALACGLIALMVSRVSAMVLDGLRNFRRLDTKSEKRLRLVSGCVAGMAFGLDDSFWGRALVPDPWPFSLLLFAGTMCLLLRWRAAPERNRRLYAAIFVYGLALTDSQSFLAAVPGLEFMILSGSVVLGRDVFAASTVFLTAMLGAVWLKILPETMARLTYFDYICFLHFIILAFIALMTLILVIKTRSCFTRWKTVFGCGFWLMPGLLICFYLPIASMANPPMNWGYPRTAEGFFHVITRGQYGRYYPVHDWGRFASQLWQYCKNVSGDFGWVYLLPTGFPFFLLHRMRVSKRNVLIGFLTLFLCLSIFMLAVVNPSTDRAERFCCFFFAASHLILALWTGLGLVLMGTMLSRPRKRLVPTGM